MNKSNTKPINDEKRFSLTIKNIDHNSHRAYKYAKDPKYDSSTILKNQQQILKESQNMRFPFGSNNIKFRSQCAKNVGEKVELSGSLYKRKQQDPSLVGTWDSLIDKTDKNETNYGFNKLSSMKKYEENNKSSRIFNLNNNGEEVNDRKNRYYEGKQLGRCGSITSLFAKTPDIEKKTKLHSDKMTKDSNIFIPDKTEKKRIRATYNHNLDSKDPLNFIAPEFKEFDINDVTVDKQRKFTGLQSDIFNKNRSIPNEVSKTKGRVSSQDERFNPYKNIQSQIIF